jgi:hypothetical protein
MLLNLGIGHLARLTLRAQSFSSSLGGDTSIVIGGGAR